MKAVVEAHKKNIPQKMLQNKTFEPSLPIENSISDINLMRL